MKLVAWSAAVMCLLGAVGCASGVEDEDTGAATGEALTARSISPNHLLDDGMVKGGASIEAAAVQAVLDDEGGYLSTYRVGGRRASDIIASASATYGIHPAYILARIQGESGLLTGGKASSLARATGCGCADGSACASASSGFEQQITCTASSMKGYFDDIASSGKTVSGWGPGISKKTVDPCPVKPDNAATAAMYTYNPWVGSNGIGCGTKNNGGSSMIASMTKKYAAKL